MKNSKKTWGILGTSMGSMLIIVALLTMVGMGSNDTYATETYVCRCSNGSSPTSDKQCLIGEEEELYTCDKGTSGAECSTHILTGKEVCQCKRTVPKYEAANCEYVTSDDDKPSNPNKPTYACVVGSGCTTSSGQPGKCIDSGSNVGGTICVPINPNKPTGGDDDQPCLDCGGGTDKPGHNCEAGQYYSGTDQSCKDCPEGSYCPGVYWPDDDTFKGDAGKFDCPSNKQPGQSKCGNDDDNDDKPTGGDDDDKPSNPNKPTGGDDKPNNPNKPTGGGDGGSGGNGGGNSGGNSGGNGNGGNTGGNNGNGNGGNNVNKNPSTATKAPLVIAIIGIISVGISSAVYFNGKKEINTEI